MKEKITNIANSAISVLSARYALVPFVLVFFAIILLPAMYLDNFFPQFNFPYVVTVLFFLVAPLVYFIRLYIRSNRVKGEKDLGVQSVVVTAEPVVADKDYRRDIFMGIFSFFFISLIYYVLNELLTMDPLNQRPNSWPRNTLPGFFVSLYFFRNAYARSRLK